MAKRTEFNDYLSKQVHDDNDDIGEEFFNKKEEKSKKGVKKKKEEDTSVEIKSLDIAFEELEKEIKKYKKNFELSTHNNVRITEENYKKLRLLKTTDIAIIHLVNILIKKVVDSKDFENYVKR